MYILYQLINFNIKLYSRSNPFYINQAFCKGDEKTIAECPNGEFFPTVDSCKIYGPAAAVYCYRKVKIEYTKPRATNKVIHGLIKVYNEHLSSKWAKVCNKGFTQKEASVVCRTMGFSYGVSFCCNSYGMDTYLKPMVQVDCSTGEEKSINDCIIKPCQDDEYASVGCSQSKIIPPNGKFS